MNNQIIPFDFENKTVRMMVIDAQEWWVGRDIAVVLGYQNPLKAINDHCRGATKRYPIVDSLGRTQEARILSEGDVFRLIVNSHLPQAVRFEKRLFEEVLPQIRKTGGYGANTGELTVLRESLMIAKSERDTYKRLWLEDRRTIQRFENRSFLTTQDKREIITLHVRKYPVSAIQRITKKGRTRIKNIIDEFLSNEAVSEALFAEWEKDEEPSESFGGPLEAPRGHDGGGV
jgi:prophage antirepressor-like protein